MTDGANGLVGSQSGIIVVAATANSLVVNSYPNATTAGVTHTLLVTARDVFGNVATGYTGTVTLASSDGQAVFVPTPYTFTPGDAGVHTFNGTLDTVGTQSITAADVGDSLLASQSGIVVTPAAAAAFFVTGYPATTAGTANNFTVTARDAFGNVATGYLGAVTFISSDSQATFAPSTFTFIAANAGVQVFSGTLRTAGTQSIIVTDSADNIGGSQNGIVVTASTCVQPGRCRVSDGPRPPAWRTTSPSPPWTPSATTQPGYVGIGRPVQQRRPGLVCSGDLRLRCRGCRRARVQRHAQDGRHPVDPRQRRRQRHQRQ